MGTWQNNNDGKPNFHYLEKENPHAPGTLLKDAVKLITQEDLADESQSLAEKGVFREGWWLIIRKEDSKGNVSWKSELLTAFKVTDAVANKQADGSTVAYELNFLGYRWNPNSGTQNTLPASGTSGWVDADIEENNFEGDGTSGLAIGPVIESNPASPAPTLAYNIQVRNNGTGKWIDASTISGLTIGTGEQTLHFGRSNQYATTANKYRWVITVSGQTDNKDRIVTAPFTITPDAV